MTSSFFNKEMDTPIEIRRSLVMQNAFGILA
jgi:hypothetical protein